MATLTTHAYGKSTIRLLRVARGPSEDRLWDLTVHVRLEGDFARAYLAGDNREIVPTATLVTAAHVVAAADPFEGAATFADRLGRDLVTRHSPLASAAVTVEERDWERIVTSAGPDPHAFHRAGNARALARTRTARDRTATSGGLRGLALLKTTGSSFAGFHADRLTTLEEVADRLLAIRADVHWRLAHGGADAGDALRRIRGALLETFATRRSNSLQEMLFAMGSAALEAAREVDEIRLRLCNHHHLLVDLAPFGVANPRAVYTVTREPHGVIEGRLRRS